MLQDLGFKKSAKYEPTPLFFDVDKMNPRNLGIYDKMEDSNNRALAYSNNLTKHMLGGAAIGAGLRFATGRGSLGNLKNILSYVRDGTPLPDKSKLVDYTVTPIADAERVAKQALAKRALKGLVIGGLAGVALTGASNIINYELARTLANKRGKK